MSSSLGTPMSSRLITPNLYPFCTRAAAFSPNQLHQALEICWFQLKMNFYNRKLRAMREDEWPETTLHHNINVAF
jgi:hypothetical protein